MSSPKFQFPSSPKFLGGLFALSLALTLSLSGCGGGGAGWQAPPPVVDVITVGQQDWTVEYTATGTLEANNKVDLNAETPGLITQIRVSEGDSISRGQVLMRIKSDKQQAQVQQSAAGIATSKSNIEQQKFDINQAQARLENATVRLKLAQSELHRYDALYRDQFVSQLELDQKRSAYDTAVAGQQEAMQALSSSKAMYAQATASLAQARSGYQYNLALAGESLIRAPFSGIVGQKYVDLGDYIAPTEKLLTVVDPSSYKIQFTVPERFLHQLRLGMPVKASFEGLPGQQFSGQINFIDPVVDMTAHTITVKAKLPNNQALRHGLFATVDVALGQLNNSVVIPEEALLPQGDKVFVYVVTREIHQPNKAATKDSHDAKDAKPEVAEKAAEPTTVAHIREVKVGHRKAGRVQIESGLSAGEHIIVNGLQKVADNQPVALSTGPQPSGGMKGQ